MAPRGRRKAGMMREDAARDAMRNYGFNERVIRESIKELLQLYGEDGWRLIEDDIYGGLLNICLEKQMQQEAMANEQQQIMADGQEEDMVEEEQEEMAHDEEENLQEQEQHVEYGRNHVGNNSTSLVVCGTETGTQAGHTDAYSINSETVIDPSPALFLTEEASTDNAHQSGEGANSSRGGWLSSEEEKDPEEDCDDGDDYEMIQLTPEPLCEELEELLREVRGQKKRKRATKWDT